MPSQRGRPQSSAVNDSAEVSARSLGRINVLAVSKSQDRKKQRTVGKKVPHKDEPLNLIAAPPGFIDIQDQSLSSKEDPSKSSLPVADSLHPDSFQKLDSQQL